MSQLLERRDQQIGFQEMLAMVLGIATFTDLLRGTLLLNFCDNDGVRVSTQKGGGASPEVSHLVSHVWRTCASEQIALYVARVESHANLADAPSRGHFEDLRTLGATYVKAVLPPWAQDLWAFSVP